MNIFTLYVIIQKQLQVYMQGYILIHTPTDLDPPKTAHHVTLTFAISG